MADTALLSYLISVAAALSGYPELPLAEMPMLRQMSATSLVDEACPDNPAECRTLVALYDRARNQILIRAELDLENPADNSFLVHEFVHVLEARHKGELYQHDCANTLLSERQAYRVQNAYLKQEGRSERFGSMLSNMVCAPGQTAGGPTVRLEMSPGGLDDERAFEKFMQEFSEGRAAAHGR